MHETGKAKRKYPQDGEPDDTCPSKQPRTLLSSHQLTEANLKLFDAINNSQSQSSSQHPACGTSDPTQETTKSHSTVSSGADYRYTTLRTAEVHVHSDPPEEVQDAVDAIINAEPIQKRRDILRSISQALCDECTKSAGDGRDDFIRHFRSALLELGSFELSLHGKAEWCEELKPEPRRLRLNPNFLAGYTVVDNQDQEIGASPIKNPCPDISIGISVPALIFALTGQTVHSIEAQLILGQLQRDRIPGEQGRPTEPVLISVPSWQASDLAFPFAVVESKPYSIGNLFKAENQAAVAGACGLKIQSRLDELAGLASPELDGQPPFFFSICTQGPVHELFVHWTNVEHGVRKFHMKILKVCHGLLLEGVEDFIIAVDNMLRWGTGKFMESVVERLEMVAEWGFD